MNHSIGPWTHDLYDDADGCIRSGNGCLVAVVHSHGNVNTIARTGETFSHDDARLISQAPTMHAALLLYREARIHFENCVGGCTARLLSGEVFFCRRHGEILAEARRLSEEVFKETSP